LFEALRPSERPRVREHNSKCTKAKGEGPHGSLREIRARYALAADAGRTRHRVAGALPPPPRAQTGWYPLCAGELNSKQAGLHLEGKGVARGFAPADRFESPPQPTG
jgi:hypothetical protein